MIERFLFPKGYRMRGFTAFPCLVFLWMAGRVFAQSPEQNLVPISPRNADKLRVVSEVKPGGERSPYKITLGPGRRELAVLYWRKSIEIVEDETFRLVRKVTTNQPDHLAVSRDGTLIAWSELNSSKIWMQSAKSRELLEFESGGHPTHVAFSPDAKLIAVGETVTIDPNIEGSGFSQVRLFDPAGKLVRTVEVTREGWGAVSPVFSPDGKLLAVGNRNFGTPVFEVSTGKRLQTFPRRMTHEVAFSPDGKTIAAAYVDGAVALWDVATGKMLHLQPGAAKELYTLDWSPRGDLLATAGHEGKIVLWNPGELVKVKELKAPSWVIQVRFDRAGTRLFCSGGDRFGIEAPKVLVWGIPEPPGK